MYVCTYGRMYVRMYMYMCIRAYIYTVYIYIYMYTHTFMHTHRYIFVLHFVIYRSRERSCTVYSEQLRLKRLHLNLTIANGLAVGKTIGMEITCTTLNKQQLTLLTSRQHFCDVNTCVSEQP